MKNKIIKNIKLGLAGGVLASGIAALTLNGCHGELGNGRYNINGVLTTIDTLKIDTIEEELSFDHFYDYVMFHKKIDLKKYLRYKILREDIKFKTIYAYYGLGDYGLLSVRKEEFLIYKPKDNAINNIKENKKENYLVHKVYALDRNLKIDFLTITGIGHGDVKKPSFAIERTYTKEERGVLEKEQLEFEMYLNKILEYKNLKRQRSDK